MKPNFVFGIALVGLASAYPRSANAATLDSTKRAPLFVLELTTGVLDAAYVGDDFGMTYGLSSGVTLKFKALPLRFYFLGNFAFRHAASSDAHLNVAFDLSRADFDLFVSHRLVLPIAWGFRIYGEGGVGKRWSDVTLERGTGFGTMSTSNDGLLFVLAAGIEYRASELLSLGVRTEWTFFSEDVDLASAMTQHAVDETRRALLAQVGFHF